MKSEHTKGSWQRNNNENMKLLCLWWNFLIWSRNRTICKKIDRIGLRFISVMSFPVSLFSTSFQNERKPLLKCIRTQNQNHLHKNLQCLNSDPKTTFTAPFICSDLKFKLQTDLMLSIENLFRNLSIVTGILEDDPFESPLGALWWWRMENGSFLMPASSFSSGHGDEHWEGNWTIARKAKENFE